MNDVFPLSKVRVEDTAVELNCSVAQSLLLYLREHYGEETMYSVVRDSEMNLDYLNDSRHWMSFDYYCRLLRKAVEQTKDPLLPFEAGCAFEKYGLRGVIAQFMKHLGSPGGGYRLVVRFHSLWDRICEYRMLEEKPASCTIQIRYPEHKQDPDNCLALRGHLAAAPRLFGLPAAKIEELKCASRGSDACVYRITWVNRPARLWGWVGALSGLALGSALGFLSLGWGIHVPIFGVLAGVLGYFMGRKVDYEIRLAEVYRQNEESAQSLLKSIRETERLNEELQKMVEARTQQLSMAKRNLERTLQDLKESQEKMLTAERRAAIGVLAAGTAHEMNSPINAIKLSLQALLEDMEKDSRLRPLAENAKRAANRCGRIVNELLSFAREPRQTTNARIEDIVTASVALFEREHAHGVHITRDIAPGLPAVTLDKLQIQQAILNILANAADAVKEKGEIRVSVRADDVGVALTIADNGPGMDESVRSRIFDPFFTTKRETGKGLGLGLSITYQLVRRNDGEISVASEPGKGTTFTLRFPANVRREAPPAARGAG